MQPPVRAREDAVVGERICEEERKTFSKEDEEDTCVGGRVCGVEENGMP